VRAKAIWVLSSPGGLRIIVLPEIEHAEIVVGRGEVWSQLEHGAIFLNGGGVVSVLLRCFGLGVEFLNLWSYFVVGWLS
jgi:hypothetical protein